MLAGYSELVPVRRPRSALFARAARSWFLAVTSPRLPGARRFAVWAAAAVLLTAVLCALPAGSAVVAGQLAAALLVLAVVVMLCESPTQLLTVLITGASPPLLLIPAPPGAAVVPPRQRVADRRCRSVGADRSAVPRDRCRGVCGSVGRGADRGAVHAGFGAVDLTGAHRGLRAGRASRRRPPPGMGTGAAHHEWAAARPPRHRPGADHSPTPQSPATVPYCWSVTQWLTSVNRNGGSRCCRRPRRYCPPSPTTRTGTGGAGADVTVRHGSPSGSATALVGAGPLEVARIGWRRARAFNVLNRGPRSWGGVLIAPWLWPVETAVVARNVGHVRTLGGASMTLSDGTRRSSRPVMLLAGLLAVAAFAIALVVAVALSRVLPGSWPPALRSVAAMGIVAAPLLVELVVRLRTLLQAGPRVRSLDQQRTDLVAKSDGPVYVMSSFVRSTRAGEGSRLLRALQVEWERTGAVVLLHPANEAVATYYARHGAEPDSGTRAVMRFDYRAAVTA